MGRAIGSRYELDDEIGRGAFGAVWRGRVRSTGEPVAIKVLLEEFAADADVVTRFLRERAALVGLHHRSLVRLRDLVVEGDILALVMQLVEGPDLKKYLAGRQRLEPVEAGLLVAEVAEGMAAAHSAGIVHRDIKPANVLLEQADGGLRPLLTDFGIARIADAPSVTRTHQVVGTPYYLAPEVVAGKKATPAADVYAAGIMLYELITGHPTFRGPDAVSVFRQHMNTVPERPAEIPTRLWPVIAAALVKEPEARPSALVLAAQLRAAVGRSVSGPDGEITHHLPVEGQYGTLRLPPIPGSSAGSAASGAAASASAGHAPAGDSAAADQPAVSHSVGAPPSAPAVNISPAAAPLPVRPTRPADGKVAGWDAPSDPDAIGAGVSRRPGSASAPTVPTQQPNQAHQPAQPAMPPQMQRQLEQMHRQQQLAAQQQANEPRPGSQQQHQRLAAYPPQPQFGQQGYQQPGQQGYQQQPGPGQPYPPSQFQASAAAPPRPVAYTPNQPPVMPPQQNRPPQRPPQQQPQQQVIVQKKVVRRRTPRLGCLIKLAILGAVAFGVYTGVNWVIYQINHFDLNSWVTHQWQHIWSNVHKRQRS